MIMNRKLTKIPPNLKVKALTYVEVLVSMVIISFVFTSFVIMAYKAVHRAKVIEQKDLMESSATTILEKFVTKFKQESTWTSGKYAMDANNNENIIPRPLCQLSADNTLLLSNCNAVEEILPAPTGSGSMNDKWAYIIDAQTSPSNAHVFKLTITIACIENTSGTQMCDPNIFPPIQLIRYVVKYD